MFSQAKRDKELHVCHGQPNFFTEPITYIITIFVVIFHLITEQPFSNETEQQKLEKLSSHNSNQPSDFSLKSDTLHTK